MPSLLDRFLKFIPTISNRSTSSIVDRLSSVSENDNTFYTGGSSAADIFRDRMNYDRMTIL